MVANLGPLTTAPCWEQAPGEPGDGLRPIFFDSVPWQGRPTKVFAWLGIPEDRDGPVPGVVLVHPVRPSGSARDSFGSWFFLRLQDV